MRICICDYSGHPFQVQLSRELARRGHEILHLHFADFQTPKGRLQQAPGDSENLAIEAVSLGRPFAKYGFIKRRFQEIAVGKLIAGRIATYAPDVVVGCNLPIDALNMVVNFCQKTNRPFIFWQQDIYSAAISKILTLKFGPLGGPIGKYYEFLERRAATRSARIVAIAEDFRPTLEDKFRVPSSKIDVIENWAPLDEIVPRPKVNSWSLAHGFADQSVVLYTGTIGMKHDPAQLLSLAKALRDRPGTSLVVASEGPSASWLAEQAAKQSLPMFKIIPFQPFEVYSDVLASADVLVSILEADAGTFSVPSKVLSYLSAGRAIVLSAPPENLASKIIANSGSGIVVQAGDADALTRAVESLLGDQLSRSRFAANGRSYAEKTFDIGRIGDRFERIIADVTGNSVAGPGDGRGGSVRGPVTK